MDVMEALEALVVVTIVVFFFSLLYNAMSFSSFARGMLESLAGLVGVALVVGLVVGLYVYWRTAIRREE